MKTSTLLLILSFVIGISIISALVIQNPPRNGVGVDVFYFQKSYFQKFWDDQLELFPDEYVISEKKEIMRKYDPNSLIEINGLRADYEIDEPIHFEVLAVGNGDGCLSFSVTINEEDKVPPVYLQSYISKCDESRKNVGVPLYFDINSENGQIENLKPGKYEVVASFYQNRGSFGEVKQDFTIKNNIEQPESKVSSKQTDSEPALSPLQIKISSENQVRRGTTHSIDIQVVRGDIPIAGARVFLDIEDYGENIIKESKGYTDSQGYFRFSWEIPQSFDDLKTLLAIIDVTDGISSKTEQFKFQVYCLPGEQNCKVKGN